MLGVGIVGWSPMPVIVGSREADSMAVKAVQETARVQEASRDMGRMTAEPADLGRNMAVNTLTEINAINRPQAASGGPITALFHGQEAQSGRLVDVVA